MHTNTYLYIIIASILIGGGAGFIAKDQYEQNMELKAKNEVVEQEIKKFEETIKNDKKELKDLSYERILLELEVDYEAKEINKILKNITQLNNLKVLYDASIDNAKKDKTYTQSVLAEIQDEMQQNIAVIERSLKQVNESFSKNMNTLEAKSEKLDVSNKKEAIIQAGIINKRKKEFKILEAGLKRENDLPSIKITEPWTVSTILNFSPESNQVIIGLGSESGLKKAMRLMVYTETLGSDRENKGIMVISEVGDFTATGEMIFRKRKGDDPLKGDSVGTFSYKAGGLNFYLAGKFEGKHSRDKVKRFLRKTGNIVSDELNTDVDILIEGKLADNEVVEATSYGIPVIVESDFTEYVGE
jgi:NAD-dependent DNA ligase